MTISNLMKMKESFSKLCVENTVGEGEIACYEQFLLYPQSFQTRKNQGLFGKGLRFRENHLISIPVKAKTTIETYTSVKTQ